MSFKLPKFAHQYGAGIIQRCEDLITAGIWGGLHINRFRRWLNNFLTDEERYFSACVLDALIYRSDDQTLALTRQLFQRVLPDMTRKSAPVRGSVDDWVDQLKVQHPQADPHVRLVPVIGPGDPPTKSGFLVARALKRYLRIDPNWIIWPAGVGNAIASGVDIIVFIDDFLGTGDQFEAFANSTGVASRFGDAYTIYAPLAAHETGIKKLGQVFPGLRVAAAETLDASGSLFDPTSRTFDDETNTAQDALDFYLNLLQTKNIQLTGPERRGYGQLELAYTFQHAAPDNCLPIFWWNQTKNWMPLFDR